MPRLRTIAVLAIALAAGAFAWFQMPPNDAAAMVCFKTGERTSGMNKICYYDCLGSEAAITISATSLCPLSINR